MKILNSSDVVFMYAAADPDVYRAYGTTFVGWGGANTADRVKFHHDLGVRCTGSMWCLTAGAKRLHEDAALREAVARDIAGEPIAVPWLWSHTHEGTPSWFGCTNNPVFRKHNRDCVREVMAGGADGLHALNWNYDRHTRQLKPLQRRQFTLPPNAVPSSASMRLLSCDGPDETVMVQYDGQRPFIEIPELRFWTLAIPCQV